MRDMESGIWRYYGRGQSSAWIRTGPCKAKSVPIDIDLLEKKRTSVECHTLIGG